MSYLKILSARRKGEKSPTLKKSHFSAEQEAWAAQGICTKCGKEKAAKTSYICSVCQADDTIEGIQKDIEALRSNLLNESRE